MNSSKFRNDGMEGLTAANTWDGVTDGLAKRYRSDYTYDANGNIQTTQRYGNEDVDANGEADQYDDLKYSYEKTSGNILRNRLYHLNETKYGGYGDIGIDISAYHNAHEDVNLLNNYKYDKLGNLIADKREEIANIEWTVSGKVKHITRTVGSTKPELWFTYGADGQRISKTVGDPLNGGYREWYLRDAQGNVMAMYKYADNGTSLKVTERPIYGSKRLGSYVRQMELVGEPAIHQWPYTQPMQAPLQRYELTDHLGNVNTVVTGRLLPMLGLGTQYQAEVVSATGYESFGFALPNRSFQSSNYGWGFGGKFKDNEMYGSEGTSYDFGERPYDPRIGRWSKLDKYDVVAPGWSPYRFGLDNPVRYSDSEGNFEVDEATAASYPNLKPALQNLLAELQKPENIEKVNILVKLAELKDANELFEILTDGKGPKLEVKDITTYSHKVNYEKDYQGLNIPVSEEWSAGFTNEGKKLAGAGTDDNGGADALTLTDFINDGDSKKWDGSKQTVVIDDNLGKALKDAFNAKGKPKGNGILNLFKSIIIHEVGHVGDERDGKRASAANAAPEVGEAMEKAMYGKVAESPKILSGYENKK